MIVFNLNCMLILLRLFNWLGEFNEAHDVVKVPSTCDPSRRPNSDSDNSTAEDLEATLVIAATC